jgi:O-antigen ligase
MYASVDFRKYKDTILNAFILSGFMMGIICLYLYRDVLTLGLGRISDINYIDAEYNTLSPLALSYGGTLTIGLCVYKLFLSKLKLSFIAKSYLIIGILASFYLFLLGSSRGSFVALLLCAPLFLIYVPGKQKVKFAAIIASSIPMVLWGIAASGSSILDRISGTLESGDITRGQLWVDAWNEFLNYPFLGNRIEIGFYPHNFILETLMSTGFIGFLLLFIVMVVAIKRVYKISFSDKIYTIPFIVLLQGFAQYSFTGAIYASVLIFIPLGIIYSSYNLQSNEKI